MSLYYIPGAERQEYFREGQTYVLNGVASVASEGCPGGTKVKFDDKPNERFYTVVERFVADRCHYDATPRPVDDVKREMIAWCKNIAGNLLKPTDWKVIRASEGVKPCDQTTLDYRATVRATSDAYEVAVDACATVEALADLPPVEWPENE